jgi:hypothetical protein
VASRRRVLLELFKTRLETIAGTKVLLGETPPFGKDDPPTALVVLPADDVVQKQQGTAIFLVLPIEIHLLARVDMDAPWVAIEELLTQVKAAIELDDELLHAMNAKRSIERGSTRTIPREPGSTVMGAVITYGIQYSETWGGAA